MSSVRITGELVRHVENQINSKFYSQNRMIRDTLAKDFGDRVYAYGLRKELKIIATLPAGFFAQTDKCSALLQHFEWPDLKIDITLTTPKAIPYDIHTTYSTQLTCNNSSLYAEYKIMNDKLLALNEEQNSVRKAITDAIKNFTTLKKFLSVMPEAEMFIPQSALNTHYQTTPKKQIVPKVPNEHLSLTQKQRVTLAKAKMSGI